MISQRIFLRLLPALLALLVLAAAPMGGTFAAQDGIAMGAVDGPAKTGGLSSDGSGGRRTAALASYLEVDDEKDQHTQSAPRIRPVATWCALIVPAAPHYHAASATHRSCAAPPTGPPHA